MNIRIALVAWWTAGATVSLAQHVDILAYQQNGKIQVNRMDVDSSTPAVPASRVFAENFTGSAGAGYSTSAPGWNTVAAFPLPASMELRFSLVPDPILDLNLAYWDGNGDVNFGAPAGGTGLIVSKGVGPGTFLESVARGQNTTVNGYVRTATASSTPIYSPSLGAVIDTTSASGTIHRHLGFLLRAGDDLVRYDLDPVPADGIYLLPIQFHMDTLADSDVSWILFSLNKPLSTRNQAAAWVSEHLENPLLGDADLDGDVDLSDLATLAGHYGYASGATWFSGDFDNDSDVDLNDLSALAANYGLGEAQAMADFHAMAAVPEPAGALSLCAALLVMGRRRKGGVPH